MYKILITEDDEVVRKNIVSFFEDEGFQVFQATDGLRALQTIEENPDIIIAVVDLKMPLLTGEKFIEESHKKNPNLHYILYTGSSNYNLCESQEVKDIIPKVHVHFKPADFDELINSVRDIIQDIENK